MSRSKAHPWPEASIAEITLKLGSGSTPLGGENVYTSEGVPLLRSQNVHCDGLRLENVVFIPPSLHHRRSRSQVRPGDVLLNLTGASLGRCALVPRGFGTANVNQHVCILRLNPDRADPRYVHAVLASPLGQRQIWRTSTGLSRPGLSREDVRKLRIPLPPIGEQRRFARFLSHVDDVISAGHEVLEQHRRVRTGVLGKLLGSGLGHTRFKTTGVGEIPASWTVYRLQDLLESCFYGISKPLNWAAKGTPVLRMANVQDGRIDLRSLKYADLSGEDPHKVLLRRGDIVLNRTNSSNLVGKVALVVDEKPLSYASYLLRLRSNGVVSSRWLFHRLAAHDLQTRLRAMATPGVNQTNINRARLCELQLAVPPRLEQERIVAVAQEWDSMMETSAQELSRWRRLKEGLLNDFVSGFAPHRPGACRESEGLRSAG